MVEEVQISQDMSDIKWLTELSSRSVDIAGAKASYLAEAYNRGNFSRNVVVPAGFVLLKSGVDSFCSAGNIRNAIKNIMSETNLDNVDEVESASTRIKNLIMKTNFSNELQEELSDAYDTLGADALDVERGLAYDILSTSAEPAFVAVRASAKGEIGDSYFNIKGMSNILYSIKRILCSFFTPDAILEQVNAGDSLDQFEVAIIIQKMVQADKSGVVYSADTIRTHAIWGLGGGLKLHEIGKDRYICGRDFRLLEKEVSEKKYAITRESSGSLKLVGLKEGYSFAQVLEEHEVQELCVILLRLDEMFSDAMRFEFAIVDSEIHIVKIESMSDAEVVQEDREEAIQPDTDEEEVVQEVASEVQEDSSLVQEPLDIVTQTQIGALIATKEEHEAAWAFHVQSGLLSVEQIIMSRGIHPAGYVERFNTKGYGEVLFSGLDMHSAGLSEVWVRLSDFSGLDCRDLEGSCGHAAMSSKMGLNGVRYLLSHSELLKRELSTIAKLKTPQNTVGVLIPKISSVYELKKVKELINTLHVDLKVGIVLEIPSSIQLIKDFIEEGIDAAVFSGDTLTEYLLGVDTSYPEVATLYDDTNPALMYQIEYVIRVCKRQDVKTGFFGAATANKEMIDYLVKKNIDSLFVPVDAFRSASQMVYHAEEEFISGTDKEARQYAMRSEQERQKKELQEFEQAKDEEVQKQVAIDSALTATASQDIQESSLAVEDAEAQDGEVVDAVEATDGDIVDDVDVAVRMIEAEKEGVALADDADDMMQDIDVSSQGVQSSGSLVIHPEGMQSEQPENVEDAITMIEAHNAAEPALNEVELAMQQIEQHNAAHDVPVDNVVLEVRDKNTYTAEGDLEQSYAAASSQEEMPENIEGLDSEIVQERLDEDIALIEQEKREYLDSEEGIPEHAKLVNGKRDTLGIF